MSDLFEDEPQSGGNAHEFSVTEISGAVKRLIEGEFGHVRVRGEVGRTTHARSGHLYFDLKDDKAVISAVSWKGQVARLQVMPEEGMEVIATGRVTTFPGQSRYQLIVESVEPAGAGALMAMLEKRKKMLESEGLFAPDRKKPIPYLPATIGVVTSPTGAVIRDILHRLRDRFPTHVLIWPVAVQGRDCAPQVARAIEGFNKLSKDGPVQRPELIIVARGGGSVEDLWGFNEEIVARAAAASDIPLISAVGHETDTTLIDYVSDKRAPTPTAAAEMAVPVRRELLAWTDEQSARLTRALESAFSSKAQRLFDLSRALPRPDRLTETARQRLDRATERLPVALRQIAMARRQQLLQRGASIRPAALQQYIAQQRQRLADRAARLTPDIFETRHARAAQELGRMWPRASSALSRQISDAKRRLMALDRTHETLSYRATLKRGYAVIRDGAAVISDVDSAKKAGAIEIEFGDGRITLGAQQTKKKRATPDEPQQGDLF